MIWVVDKTARHVSSTQQSADGWYAASLTRLTNQASTLDLTTVPCTSYLAAHSMHLLLHIHHVAMLSSVVPSVAYFGQKRRSGGGFRSGRKGVGAIERAPDGKERGIT